MNKGLKIFLIIIAVIIVAVVLFLGYLGYVPGVSAVFGSNKPRDLGITYTEADLSSARDKSQLEYGELPANTPDEQSVVRTGSHPTNFSLTSAEASALMNDRPYKYWPYDDVQMKFNADGSAEVSGRLIKDRIPGYAAGIGVNKEVAERVVKYLPPDAVFYVKARAALSENKVSLLDPSIVEVGRMSIPVNWILSFAQPNIAYAQDSSDVQSELQSYSGKKAKIIEYINSHLSGIKGFYAKNASFAEDALKFDGSLNDQELTAR